MATLETTAAEGPMTVTADALAAWCAACVPSAGVLDELACDDLSAAGRIDAVVAWERLVRHAHAGLVRALGVLARDGDAGPGRWLVESEVSAALAWSPAVAQTRLRDADALTRLFPESLHELSEGRIAVEQTRALVELTAGLDEDAARAVEARVLPRMPARSVASTRQAIRRAVLHADPQAAEQRHRYERDRRRVELRPEDDGMATLSFYLPAEVAQMAWRTLTALAHRAKRHNKLSGESSGGTNGRGDTGGESAGCDIRTLDQRRADLLPTLLLRATGAYGSTRARTPRAGTAPGALDTLGVPAIPARVTVVVGVDTLLGHSDEPGHLDGYGPINAEHTRTIAHTPNARWRLLLTAPDGTPLDATPRTYTPRAALRHLAQLQHTTCAFPHCSMPADRCDLDHNQPFERGGLTTSDNLAPLCRRHHNHKTRGHWTLTRDDQAITWTSAATGRTYNTTPTRYQPAPVTN